MRYLSILTTLALTGLCVMACVDDADIANSRSSDAKGGNTHADSSVGGAAAGAPGAGGAATGGTASSTGGTTAAGAATGGTSNQATTAAVEEERSNVAPVTAPDISDSEYASFIADANTFGLELAQKVEIENGLIAGNSVFSPTSAQIALAMTYAGAANATALAMKTALHDNLGGAKYHAGCNRLLRDMASRNFSGKYFGTDQTVRVELAPANSLWVERTFSLKTSFMDLLSQNYDSGTRRVDFVGQPDPSRQAINAWVEERTHDRIKDLLLPADVTSATRLVLVNALYLYANWQSLFDENVTVSLPFQTLEGTSVQVSMMRDTRPLDYKATETTEVIKLPYITGNLWMTLVLPKAGQFETVRAAASGAWLAELTGSMTSTSVQLALPRFKIETAQLKLTQPLVQLGMGVAFSGSADFSGMGSGPLAISDVVQKAFIGVDEKGTEAAAATAVMVAGSIPQAPVPVTFNRPFLFFVQDKTGLVLFSGHVVDPTK